MENQGLFKCLKITLIVLYVLSIIAFICLIAMAVFGLAVINSDSVNPDHEIKPQEKEEAKLLLTVAIIVSAISLVFLIIALIGVIKENKIIMTIIVVLGILGCVAHLVKGDIVSAILGTFSLLITGGYTYLIYQKDKMNGPV